jgi:hypothetical protein
MAIIIERKPSSASLFEISNIPLAKRGVGGTQPTTVVNGSILAEAFTNGDQLFLRWPIPERLDRTNNVVLRTLWYVQGSEGSKNISVNVVTKSVTATGLVTGTTGTVSVTNSAIPATVNTSFELTFTFAAATYLADTVRALMMRVDRVSSSANPTNEPAMYSASMRYKLKSV